MAEKRIVSVKFEGIDEPVNVEFSEVQIEFINSRTSQGLKVPYYATTFSKVKYGDCLLGTIEKIIEEKNEA